MREPTREPRREPMREPRRETPRDDDASRTAPKGPHPKTHNAPEHKVAGRNACLALFAARRDDIRRVYVTEENLKAFGEVLRWCAQRRIAYHVKTSADLDQIAETMHHDGVLFLAREKKPQSFHDLLAALPRHGPLRLVVLENVKNPHNLGAILRVCAHFGVPAVLAAGSTPALSPAAMRTAEGGAEHTNVVPVGDGVAALETLKARSFQVVATTSHTERALGAARLPERAVIMFGSEGEGLSARLVALADTSLAIPGSGALESLNVACAASVLLWEHWRASSPPHAPSHAPVSKGARR
jgi:RNA methyltransferase, TrmH family